MAGAFVAPLDSIGTEKRSGQDHVVHKIVKGETLFSLSRRYRVSVAQISSANPGVNAGLRIDQILYIPRAAAPATAATTSTPATTVKAAATPTPVSTSAPVATAAPAPKFDAKGNRIHQVESKQTLFSISNQYNVSTADIKRWNNLTSDVVNIGENLIVGLASRATAPEEPIARPEPPAPTPVATRPVETTRSTTEVTEEKEKSSETITKIIQSGLAEVIDSRNDNNKYLALHKSAPVGTILQVKNIMNNQSVYVRVIGKLPETGANDKVVVKISKRAYQKLAALDNKFRVEVSYMP